jgi:hypothetical protein
MYCSTELRPALVFDSDHSKFEPPSLRHCSLPEEVHMAVAFTLIEAVLCST